MLSYCQNCGNPVVAGAANCQVCGQRVQNGRYQNPPQPGSGSVPHSPQSGPHPFPLPSGAPSILPPSGSIPHSPQSSVPVTPAQAGTIQQRFETLNGLIRQYPVPRLRGPLSFLYRMYCPFCDYKFHPSDCAVYGFDNQLRYVLLEEAPKTNFERSFARLHITSLNIGEYNRKGARRQCPRCGSLLPNGFESYPTFTIAVIGDAASGKSFFITALLHLLNEGKLVEQGNNTAHFYSLTPETTAAFKRNDETLFEDNRPLDPTYTYQRLNQPASSATAQGNIGQPKSFIRWEPLIFRLTIGYKEPRKDFGDNLLNLIFYDIAGEDIIKDKTQYFTWPLSRAKGIIHVVDPLRMPGIFPYLPSSKEVEYMKNYAPQGTKPHVVLRDVVSALVANAGGNPRKQVSTPVAIVLSKSDLLDAIVRRRRPSAKFLHNPTYTGNVDIGEIEQNSKEIMQLLQEFGENQLVSEGQRFDDVMFFAASATGQALGQNTTFPKVEPRRCLDPFLWLLWKLTNKK